MFLIRAIFWLTVVYLLLPSVVDQGPERPPSEAVTAAADLAGTANEVYGFCSSQPDACSAGTRLWTLADRGRRLVHGWLGASSDASAAAVADPQPDRPADRPAALPGDTLTDDDLEPEWQGPDPRQNT